MRIATYNVLSGGFDGYDAKSECPPRLAAIRGAVVAIEADVIGLVDTFRWPQLFSDGRLARSFGYAEAFQAVLGAERVDSRIGLALLSRYPMIAGSVRLGPRNVIKAIVEPPGKPRVLVYLVYLDDRFEALRASQLAALHRDASGHRGMATVVMGDFNAVRPRSLLSWSEPVLRAAYNAVRPLRDSYLYEAVTEMAAGQVIAGMTPSGYLEAARFGRGASCFKGPVGLGLDYIWARDCRIDGYRRWPHRASDHRPISAEISFDSV